MRFTGTVTSWNDDRGFGFVEADQGGDAVFFHIKSFPMRAGRPQVRQRITFEVTAGRDGKKRATNVDLLRPTRARRPAQTTARPAAWGTASLFAVPAFLVVYLAVSFVWRVPLEVAIGYVAASGVCFLAYAVDKSAAKADRWRIAESTLLGLGLLGGWPGAILAQQVLRHKSAKASFRSAFWGTVALNVAGFVAIAWAWSASGRA